MVLIRGVNIRLGGARISQHCMVMENMREGIVFNFMKKDHNNVFVLFVCFSFTAFPASPIIIINTN